MASFGPGLLLLLLLLLLITHPGPLKAQHWSHGWYPGGKRASSSPQDPQHAPRPPGGQDHGPVAPPQEAAPGADTADRTASATPRCLPIKV
ncbi:progonadoliberin-2 [Camelus ferus]|uniref:Progonadoliberin n=1 Tax=Camelus ferus TaxID=419612 RepID=A0A8B8RIS3_CAMFR|nr:progonadoliberin-2 [Camelus ferus]